jgi:hypothetical protein
VCCRVVRVGRGASHQPNLTIDVSNCHRARECRGVKSIIMEVWSGRPRKVYVFVWRGERLTSRTSQLMSATATEPVNAAA